MSPACQGLAGPRYTLGRMQRNVWRGGDEEALERDVIHFPPMIPCSFAPPDYGLSISGFAVTGTRRHQVASQVDSLPSSTCASRNRACGGNTPIRTTVNCRLCGMRGQGALGSPHMTAELQFALVRGTYTTSSWLIVIVSAYIAHLGKWRPGLRRRPETDKCVTRKD